jgi:chromosome partitioning protein
MNKIISIVNQKGGVGKTTTAVNLATGLAAVGFRVLLVDVDPQGNATTGVGIEEERRTKNIYRVLSGLSDMEASICNTLVPNLFIVPSIVDLAAAELDLASFQDKEMRLKKALSRVSKRYDFVIVDCPPSLGMITINALTASDSLIIPLQCEFYSLEGLAHLLNTVELIKRRLNPKLAIDGLLLTMVDKRNRLTAAVETEVRDMFGDLVYDSMIPRNIKLSEAPSHGKPAILYDTKCLGSVAYMMLVKELIEKFRANDNREKENEQKQKSTG